MNISTLVVFVIFLAVTLAITGWASRRSGSRQQFYAAGGSITGVQNGFAFAGDYMSAATLLGIAGLYFTVGFDGFIYNLLGIVGWPVLLFLLADKLRRLGRYTLTDVMSVRLQDRPVRIFSASANLIVLVFYMVSQLVGAGVLMNLLLGLSFGWSALLVGVLMTTYVVFGGMVATTWVQIVKAALLIVAAVILAALVLARFDFNLGNVLAAAAAKHPLGTGIMQPASVLGPGAALSLALTLTFGPAGLPHIMMRFFTVPNVAEARRSACVATAIVAGFCMLMIIIGYGTIAVLAGDPQYVTDGATTLKGGSNMAALYLAQALGGNVFLGFVAAVAFATILAVVSGLTLAAAATVSHDLYSTVIRRGKQTEAQEIRVSRWAAFSFAALSIALSVVFRNENITFLSVIAFSLAASVTFPTLMLSLFWKPLTTAGAIAGGTSGLVMAVGALVLGPSIWVAVLGYPEPIFPYQYPTIAAMPLAFAVAVIVSLIQQRSMLKAGTQSV